MSRFKLKETTVKVRGESFTVRELTHAERSQWVKDAQADNMRGPALLISLGAVDPKVTADEVDEFPSDVVQDLFTAVMEISGMSRKEDGEKKSNAG